MPSTADLDALKNWLVANGGGISSDITVRHNARSGVHCQALGDVSAGTSLFSVPHSVALSSLNALVDEDFTEWMDIEARNVRKVGRSVESDSKNHKGVAATGDTAAKSVPPFEVVDDLSSYL